MAQAPTKTVSLGSYWNHYIEDRVQNGRYASATDLIRDSLRLMEEREADSTLQALRNALIAGEDSGDAGVIDMESIRQDAKVAAGLKNNAS